MGAYVLRRLFLMIPTIIGILAVTFAVVQFAPGGPVEQVIAQLQGTNVSATARVSGGGGDFAGTAASNAQSAGTGSNNSKYRGAQGMDPAIIAKLEKQFGFDKPPLERFGQMLWNYAHLDFGYSYFRDVSVLRLIQEKLPVSISLGLWLTLISYIISIPLGIRKALKDGARFDTWTSAAIVVGYAIPSFLFAILLIILLAGGNSFAIGLTLNDTFYGVHLGCDCFPLRGLWSDQYTKTPWYQWITDPKAMVDYFWHLALPLIAMVVGAFATTTMLTKNSFLEEIRKQYVVTARAKGLTERRVLYGHVFRNAMLLVISGFPGAFISAFFAGSLLIEEIFSLDGMGLLSYESVVNRDYPVVFGTLFVFSLIGLAVNLISDLTYTWIDPRIDFATREV